MRNLLPGRDHLRGSSRLWRTLLFCLLLLALLHGGERSAFATLRVGGPLEVRILYDNSGSMYPGYAPPGGAGTPRSVSGVGFFHEYPEFQGWLSDFVARQTILDGSTVSMWTFTSHGEFTPGDIRQVHPRAPIREFNVSRALAGFPADRGDTTYLTEGLSQFARGFEGLVWLITDNVIETRRGEPNRDVERFFVTLRDQERYRSVHLFKLPFRDERRRQSAALAVYGILVSQEEVAPEVLAYFDRKLRSDFRSSNRSSGNPPPPLFPGREHLKLKNLAIDALELQAAPSLQIRIENQERGLFRENQTVRFELAGTIRSYLTQHSVTGGKYSLIPLEPFAPEPWAREKLGLEPIAPQTFGMKQGELGEWIPPNGSREIREALVSREPISFATRGLGAWLRTALYGATVQYTGTVQMSFEDVRVRLERDRMAGIFGVDRASSIFDIQEFQTLPVTPTRTQVSFALRTNSRRTLLLLLVLGLVATPLGAAGWTLSRKRYYRIHLSGAPARVVALRRLGRYDVLEEGKRLGHLSRGLLGSHRFEPSFENPAVSVTPGRDADTFDVHIRDGRSCSLAIEPLRSPTTPAGPSGRPAPSLPGRPVPRADSAPGPSPDPAPGGARPRPKMPRP